MLQMLPKNGVIAELGVDEGGFSARILKLTQPAKLHLIDMWGSERFGDAKEKSVRERFADEVASDRVTIHKGDSLARLAEFEDDYFDWVYIDTSHAYEQTVKELELCRSKVKSGGIIAGHDYCQGSIAQSIAYGVVQAVHEFCAEYDWEMIYLTLEDHMHWSYALKAVKNAD